MSKDLSHVKSHKGAVRKVGPLTVKGDEGTKDRRGGVSLFGGRKK